MIGRGRLPFCATGEKYPHARWHQGRVAKRTEGGENMKLGP